MLLNRLDTRVEIKAVDTSQRRIDGYAAAIGNKDRVGDVIDQGAFDRTLKENEDVLVFIGHDSTRLPVGEPVAMRTESKGLFTSTRVYETHAGDELLEVAKQRMQGGRTLGMSIGYRTVKSRPGGGARHLLDVDLVEYSFLASPNLAANPLATVVGVKQTSLIAASFEDLQRDLTQAARQVLGGGYCCVCATYVDHVIVMVDSMMGMDSDGGAAAESTYWDIPYSLGPDGEPLLGTPAPVQPAYVDGAAKARGEAHRLEEQRMQEEKATWDAAYVNDLSDSAFAFIEPGGAKDDSGLTTPRALRHFPHHKADGSVDLPHLRNALARAGESADGEKAMSHLEKHAAAEKLGGTGEDGKSLIGDVHEPEWAQGAAPILLVASHKALELAVSVADDRKAFERLGHDTKAGARMNNARRKQLRDLIGQLQQLADWADAVEAGEDGKLRADWYRNQMALMDLPTLKEVA